MSGKRRPDIQIGDRFGELTVMSFERRGVNSIAVCQCDCGNLATPSTTVLRQRAEHSCGNCSRRRAWSKIIRIPFNEIEFRIAQKNYRKDAERRKRLWALPDWLFRALYNRACTYCGIFPSRGVDRRNNKLGYTVKNSVPCCAKCNYAKRDMTEFEFLLWLRRLAEHQGFIK